MAQALAGDNPRQLYRLVRPLHAADHADLIERYSGHNREVLVTVLGRYFDPETLTYLDDNVREEILPLLDEEVLRNAMQTLESDDAVEILGELDDEDQARLLDSMPERERAMVEEGLNFDEASAGRLMQREMVTVPEHWTVGQTIDYLRTTIDLPNNFYDIFVADPDRRPLGKLSLSNMLRSKRPVRVAEIMRTDFHTVPAVMDQEDVAMLFRQYGLVSAPRSEEHTSELQSHHDLVCRLLLEKKKKTNRDIKRQTTKLRSECAHIKTIQIDVVSSSARQPRS